MEILPPKHKLVKFLEHNDFFLWQYYGNGFLSKIQAWIFRSRIRILIDYLKKKQRKYKIILDIGCGPMFVSYSIILIRITYL